MEEEGGQERKEMHWSWASPGTADRGDHRPFNGCLAQAVTNCPRCHQPSKPVTLLSALSQPFKHRLNLSTLSERLEKRSSDPTQVSLKTQFRMARCLYFSSLFILLQSGIVSPPFLTFMSLTFLKHMGHLFHRMSLSFTVSISPFSMHQWQDHHYS